MRFEKTGIQLFSDIHGECGVFDKIDKERPAIFLGDIFDRGDDVVNAVNNLYNLKKGMGSDLTIIRGNHDVWLYEVLDIKKVSEVDKRFSFAFALRNGFVDNFSQLFALTEEERLNLRRLTNEDYMELPMVYNIINFFARARRNDMWEKLVFLYNESVDCHFEDVDFEKGLIRIKFSHSGEEDNFANFYTSTSKMPRTYYLSIMGHWKMNYTNEVYYYFSNHVQKEKGEFKLIQRKKNTQVFALINGETDNFVELDDILEEMNKRYKP